MLIAIDNRARVLTEYLQHFAGDNHIEDARKTGYIRFAHDVLKMEIDDLKETE